MIAVFIDRDGTLIKEKEYFRNTKDIFLLPQVAKAIRLLNTNKILAIITTNQSGIARGYFSEKTLQKIHQRLNNLVVQKKAFVDGIYYCPHHPQGVVKKYRKRCYCRKPNPGLAFKANKDLGEIDFRKSYVIGDKDTDIRFAKRIKAKSILVLTGYGKKKKGKVKSDYVTKNLYSAVKWIIKNIKLDCRKEQIKNGRKN